MSSPLVPSPIAYGDIPSGANFALTVTAARAPSNTIDKQYPANTFWLSSLDMFTLNAQNQRVYGNGNIYYQAGNSSGIPNWTLISSGSFATTISAGNKTAGTVALSGGTATISTTAVNSNSQIRLYRQGIGTTGAAALGIITLGTRTAGTSFVIRSVQAADATALQTTDASVIGWEIIN